MKTTLSFILSLVIVATGYSRTLIVGAGQAITTLKSAIQLAMDHDSILLKNGIYKEGNIILVKSLSIIGEGHAVLDGESKYEILTISGKNIVIKNIRFQNAGYSALNDYASIKLIDASYITIESNTILNSYFAIHLANSSFCNIRNNIITGSPRSEQLTGNGIHLWKCDHAVIENNCIKGHRDGIYFEFVTESLIQNNLSEKNIRYGLHFMFSHGDHYVHNIFRNNGAGVAVMYSHKVTMEKNRFESNWGPSAYGILLKEISDSRITNNTFSKNTVGIFMEGSSRMDIQQNSFNNNGWALKVQASCDDNRFIHNNFRGNSFDVATNGSISLNTFSNNYWDKYEGYDLNRDGTGDIPYHPVSLYAMVVGENPTTLMLMRSFMVSLMDKAEKAIPGLTPANLVDNEPSMKPFKQ
jgi:nitrous oxidase accessory protein